MLEKRLFGTLALLLLLSCAAAVSIPAPKISVSSSCDSPDKVHIEVDLKDFCDDIIMELYPCKHHYGHDYTTPVSGVTTFKLKWYNYSSSYSTTTVDASKLDDVTINASWCKKYARRVYNDIPVKKDGHSLLRKAVLGGATLGLHAKIEGTTAYSKGSFPIAGLSQCLFTEKSAFLIAEEDEISVHLKFHPAFAERVSNGYLDGCYSITVAQSAITSGPRGIEIQWPAQSKEWTALKYGSSTGYLRTGDTGIEMRLRALDRDKLNFGAREPVLSLKPRSLCLPTLPKIDFDDAENQSFQLYVLLSPKRSKLTLNVLPTESRINYPATGPIDYQTGTVYMNAHASHLKLNAKQYPVASEHNLNSWLTGYISIACTGAAKGVKDPWELFMSHYIGDTPHLMATGKMDLRVHANPIYLKLRSKWASKKFECKLRAVQDDESKKKSGLVFETSPPITLKVGHAFPSNLPVNNGLAGTAEGESRTLGTKSVLYKSVGVLSYIVLLAVGLGIGVILAILQRVGVFKMVWEKMPWSSVSSPSKNWAVGGFSEETQPLQPMI